MPELAPLVRRVIRHRVPDPATAEDLAQEALERLVAIEHRLDPTALAPYAVVTARNRVRGWARSRARDVRLTHRIVDPRQPEDPEEAALREEEHRAVATALEQLPAAERQSLIAHDVEGMETKALAERLGTTPGAVSVRLSRTRARLRVEYLLALRRLELPTSSCQPVLFAISAGDKRQQRALGAGEHLLTCPECAALSDVLVQRRRPLAALLPFLGLDHLARWLRRTARAHPAPTATAGVGAVALAAVIAFSGDGSPPPELFVRGSSSIPLTGRESMAPYAGMPVEARAARVQSVVDRSGFWVGSSGTERVWVDAHQSALPELAPGQRVAFQGTLRANTPETLERAGRGGPGDRAHLERQAHHVDLAGGTVQPARSPR